MSLRVEERGGGLPRRTSGRPGLRRYPALGMASVGALSMAAGLIGFGAGPAGAASVGPIHVVASTVPANGDINPYGVAIVQNSMGKLVSGNILVSNFNNSANQQGTGSTIVQISPSGQRSTFAHVTTANLPKPCPGGIGLTTALSVLPSGWVVVGSLPTTNGMSATARAGCLLVLNSNGKVVETWSGHGINGPWDMTAATQGYNSELFVTNVLNGTVAAGGSVVHRGTVLRIDVGVTPGSKPVFMGSTVIGSHFAERTDPAALVVGPTGVGLAKNGDLYVADTVRNRIQVISGAVHRTTTDGQGTTVTSGRPLNGPLGLEVTSKGTILSVNGGNGKLVATDPSGTHPFTAFLDKSGMPPGSGALFGLASMGSTLYFVDDATNTLNSTTLP